MQCGHHFRDRHRFVFVSGVAALAAGVAAAAVGGTGAVGGLWVEDDAEVRVLTAEAAIAGDAVSQSADCALGLDAGAVAKMAAGILGVWKGGERLRWDRKVIKPAGNASLVLQYIWAMLPMAALHVARRKSGSADVTCGELGPEAEAGYNRFGTHIVAGRSTKKLDFRFLRHVIITPNAASGKRAAGEQLVEDFDFRWHRDWPPEDFHPCARTVGNDPEAESLEGGNDGDLVEPRVRVNA